jgi:prepilin-type N-terminal cleavage/methylation domain-containing protein
MRGFTLIELMIVVILIAVFAAFTVPAFKHRMARTKVESYTDELLTALRYARSEAIARGTDVSLENAAGQSLENGWEVTSTSFGGSPVDLRKHNVLNGVKICLSNGGVSWTCDVPIAFTFNSRGAMSAVSGGGGAGAAPVSRIKVLVRPVVYNNVAGDPSAGTGLVLDVGTQGHARISEDPPIT